MFLNACSEVEEQPSDLAILNGTVIDLETGQLLQQHIYITDGRIEWIVDATSEEKKKVFDSIDATGKFILPGFWDNHVHFRGGDALIEANKNFLKLFIANGITSVRDAGGDLTTSVLQWQQQIANETLLGPTIYTSGPKIDGPAPTWAGSLEVVSEADVTSAVDSLENLGVDFIKLYDSTISAEAYLQTIQEAEERGIITSGHMPFSVNLSDAITTGLDGVEHLYYVLKGCSSVENEITQRIASGKMGFWDSMAQLIASKDAEATAETFKLLKDNDTYVIPTLHIGQVLSYLDEEDHRRDPYLSRMTPGMIATYKGRIDRALNASPETSQNRKDLNTLFTQLAKELSENGVQLLAGSDSGAFNSYTYPGISLHRELDAMVAAGISPLEALKSSAYNGSRFLQQESEAAALKEGFPADIVLLNANPLKNIKHTHHIYKVIKGTQVVVPSELLSR